MQQDCINEFFQYSKVKSVGSCRFQIHFCIPPCEMSSEFTREVVMKFLRIQRSYRIKKAYHACRNADLNLKLVAATANG